MCKILLSINPQYVQSIFDGTKEYEFRKIQCKEKVDGIIIYATYPVMKVVAEVEVEEILVDTPKEIWKVTKKKSGISQEFFFKYFAGRTKAIAYKLRNLNIFEEPKTLQDYGVSAPPQSFVYVQAS